MALGEHGVGVVMESISGSGIARCEVALNDSPTKSPILCSRSDILENTSQSTDRLTPHHTTSQDAQTVAA